MIEGLLISAIFLQIIAFFIWIVGIKPFLKENGMNTLRGVDGLTTVINDIQQAMEVSKKHGKRPLSLQMLITVEVISAVLFIVAAVV